MAAFTSSAAISTAATVTCLSKPATTSSLSPSEFPLKTLTFKTTKPTTATSRFTTTITAAKKSSHSHSHPKAPPPTSDSHRTLKSRLRGGGDPLYGIFLLSFSPTVAEIAALAGYDYAVVDMEHGPGGITDALHCLRALAAVGTPAVLRIPESSPTWAKKALDLGPQGIMFPMIDSPKDAKKAVSYCRFPPKGIRGTAHTVVRASRYGIDEGYVSNYEDDLVIMCQVESEEGAKKATDIAAVEGVDCVQMGPLDLSADMGYLWDPGHKKVREVQRAAEKAVVESGGDRGGAYLSGFAMPHDPPEELASRGYHMVAGAVDVGLLRKAAVEDVRRFRMSVAAKSEDEGEEEEHVKDGDDKYWSE